MEEMSLVIAVGVPYEVEITATGIPMHEAKVEFCIPKSDINYNFPAKMVDDKRFVFTITDALKDVTNKTHKYCLYVHYGNARFEADSGSFNLVDKSSFDVKLKGEKKSDEKNISERLLDKTKKRPKILENLERKIEVTKKLAEAEQKNTVTQPPENIDETKAVHATKPTPTPTVEPTTTLKDAKAALRKDKNNVQEKSEPKKEPVDEKVIDPENDPNARIKSILANINKSATPSIDLAPTATTTLEVTETQKAGKFFEDVEKMRELNQRRKANKTVKNAIKNSSNKKDY